MVFQAEAQELGPPKLAHRALALAAEKEDGAN